MTEVFIGPRSDALGSFDATPEGAEAAGAAAAQRAAELGIERVAERARIAMAVLVSWLANHGHRGGRITAGMRYHVKTRELELRASDAGSLLPALFEGEQFRHMLATAGDIDNGAWPLPVGRAVWTRLRVPAFTVRYTWSVPAGIVHPEHTYEHCDTEELAERAARWAVGNRLGACGLLVTEVAVREGAGAWRLAVARDDAAIGLFESAEAEHRATSTRGKAGAAPEVRSQVETAER